MTIEMVILLIAIQLLILGLLILGLRKKTRDLQAQIDSIHRYHIKKDFRS